MLFGPPLHDDASSTCVRVAGHRLGYVPRGMTGSYAYEWGLAHVESKGEAADSGITGVKVRSARG